MSYFSVPVSEICEKLGVKLDDLPSRTSFEKPNCQSGPSASAPDRVPSEDSAFGTPRNASAELDDSSESITQETSPPSISRSAVKPRSFLEKFQFSDDDESKEERGDKSDSTKADVSSSAVPPSESRVNVVASTDAPRQIQVSDFDDDFDLEF